MTMRVELQEVNYIKSHFHYKGAAQLFLKAAPHKNLSLH
jgi:hypothetical protein